MMTEHKFHIGSSCDMQELEDNSIELVVTSPPYPMIEMWDIKTCAELFKMGLIVSKIKKDVNEPAYLRISWF